MKIGLFGDSYIDLMWNMYPDHNPTREEKPWSYRLLDDMGSRILTSGKGGSNQFYAIKTWMEHFDYPFGLCDVAIFTFTWENRMYSEIDAVRELMHAGAELRDYVEGESEFKHTVETAIHNYKTYLQSQEQQNFLYELMVKWILDLPRQYPNTKFIFLPNTEFARQTVLRNFKDGVMVNFTFEALSNLETGSPGIMPVNCGRTGHLRDKNHEAMTSLVKGIIKDYDTIKNTIIDPDFSKFDLIEVPVFKR